MLFRALIVDSEEKIVALLAHNLMSEFEADVAQVSTAAEALTLIKNERHFDLIITRDKIGDESTAQLLVAELYETPKKRYIFVIGNTNVVYKDLVLIPEKFRIEEFNRALVKTLGLSKEQLKEAKLPDYIAIPIKSFYFITSSCCDIYIKLKRKDEDQYIKRLFAGDNFDQNTIKRYEEQGLNELFIKKENREAFLNLLLQSSTPPVSTDVSIATSSKKYELQKDILNMFGLNDETMGMANSFIKEMLGVALKNKKLGPLLKELLSKEGSYAFKHSQLICFFSALILPKLDIGKGKFFAAAMEKMSFAAFFHDLLLMDDSYHTINSKLTLYEAKLDDKARELVMNHPNLMATMIQSQSGVPTDVDHIIRQHHGVSHGVGFVEMPNVNIGPYAILFVVLEDFSDKILNFEKEKSNVQDIFKSLYAKYSLPTYKKIVDALKSCVAESM